MEDVAIRSRIGTLHTEEVIKRYREAGADLLVLMFLTSGVPLFLKDLNVRRFPRGHSPNNNSAKAQAAFVSSTLLDWENQGFIQRVPLSEVQCLLPLTVAERWSHSRDTLKYRLVLDCSPLTKNLAYGNIKLPDLNYLRHQIRQHDYLSLIDITSFYLHFVLERKYSAYFCFSWDFGDGRGRIYFRPIVMLFGIPHAPWVVTLTTNVVVRHFKRALDILINPFIDDFSHICHQDENKAKEEYLKIIEEIPKWGFVVSVEKLVPPAQKNLILGYYLDTSTMTISFDERKLKELEFLIFRAIEPVIRVRYLAKIIGKLYSLGFASRVPVAPFLPRSISLVAAATENQDWRDWQTMITITEDIYEELVFLVKALPKWNGVPMHKPYRLHFFHQDPSIVQGNVQHYVGDAGREACAVFAVNREYNFFVEYFDLEMSETSSARRELASLETLILHRSDMLMPNTTLVYSSDNLAINRWINAGSCKIQVAEVLKKIFIRCFELQIDLRVTWVPREDFLLQQVDAMGRRDTDEFGLRRRDSEFLKQQYPGTFSLDIFASDWIHTTRRFYSRFPTQKSAGADGLHQKWYGDIWAFPPRKLLAQTIYRIFSEKTFYGALLGIDTAEAHLRSLMCREGHAHPMVMKLFKFPIKIRMASGTEDRDPVYNSFSANWHDVICLFINKDMIQQDMALRCLQPVGKCQVCPGNPSVWEEKIPY